MYPPRARTFRAPKALEHLPDCQDAIFPEAAGYESSGTVFAVADGSTSTFYAGRWAELLTDGFAEEPDLAFEDWHGWLGPLREDWRRAVTSRLAANSSLAPDIRLIFENKIEDGCDAGATFAGLQLLPPQGDGAIPWRALAVGDACLFHLHTHGLASLPLTDAAQFDFRTVAVSSIEDDLQPQRFASSADPGRKFLPAAAGDVMILATDEMAKWLLKNWQEQTPVWGEILALGERSDSAGESNHRFQEFVERARNHPSQPLGNDDVALGLIFFGETHAQYLGAQGGLLPPRSPALQAITPAPLPAVPAPPSLSVQGSTAPAASPGPAPVEKPTAAENMAPLAGAATIRRRWELKLAIGCVIAASAAWFGNEYLYLRRGERLAEREQRLARKEASIEAELQVRYEGRLNAATAEREEAVVIMKKTVAELDELKIDRNLLRLENQRLRENPAVTFRNGDSTPRGSVDSAASLPTPAPVESEPPSPPPRPSIPDPKETDTTPRPVRRSTPVVTHPETPEIRRHATPLPLKPR